MPMIRPTLKQLVWVASLPVWRLLLHEANGRKDPQMPSKTTACVFFEIQLAHSYGGIAMMDFSEGFGLFTLFQLGEVSRLALGVVCHLAILSEADEKANERLYG